MVECSHICFGPDYIGHALPPRPTLSSHYVDHASPATECIPVHRIQQSLWYCLKQFFWFLHKHEKKNNLVEAHSYVLNEQESCFRATYVAIIHIMVQDVWTEGLCQLQSTRWRLWVETSCILLRVLLWNDFAIHVKMKPCAWCIHPRTPIVGHPCCGTPATAQMTSLQCHP